MTGKIFDNLSDAELKEACKKMDSKLLATRIAIFRHLDLNKRLAIQCMEELSTRRANGDDFNFEKYIENKIAQFPPTKPDNAHRGLKSLIINEIKSYGT